MSVLIPFLALDQTCEQVQTWVEQQLTSMGFRVARTFDLKIARLGHPECPCPHHGTENCTCQMVILLVYRKRGDPATLVIHGQDDRTWLSLATPSGPRAKRRLEMAIRRALMPRPPAVSSPMEVMHETRSTI